MTDVLLRAQKEKTGGAELSYRDDFAAGKNGMAQILDDPSGVVPVFQPVVELSGRRIIGFEALARWPEFPGINPADAFDRARREGSLPGLDWWCRRRAVEVTRAHRMDPSRYLFINVEPHSMSTPPPWGSADDLLHEVLDDDTQIILELTERTLLSDPPAMLATVAWARRNSFGIALDDVGSRPECIALLDVIAPDVVKLDRDITQMTDVSVESATVISATADYARRHGATVLAEGIEQEFDATCADNMGATLGQGFLYGRPGPLPDLAPLAGPRPELISPTRGSIRPLADILADTPTTVGPLADVMAMCEVVENSAAIEYAPGCVVAALRGPRHVGAELGVRYRAMARRHHLVGLSGAGLGHRPIPGVYGPATPTDSGDGVFAVAAIGADYAIAVIGRGVDGPVDTTDSYRWSVTTDRAVVADIARSTASDLSRG